MDTAVFLNQRANVCEHTTKMASLEFLKGATRGVARGMDGGKCKRRLSEVNAIWYFPFHVIYLKRSIKIKGKPGKV